MIFDGAKPDYAEIIKSAESELTIHCRHTDDFMAQAQLMDYGDVALCPQCNQYFTKIKTMPRVVREHVVWHDSPSGKIKVTMKPAHQHWERICLVRVPVRLLDEKQKDSES